MSVHQQVAWNSGLAKYTVTKYTSLRFCSLILSYMHSSVQYNSKKQCRQNLKGNGWPTSLARLQPEWRISSKVFCSDFYGEINLIRDWERWSNALGRDLGLTMSSFLQMFFDDAIPLLRKNIFEFFRNPFWLNPSCSRHRWKNQKRSKVHTIKFPSPNTTKILDSLSGATYFSHSDLNHQV